MSANFANSQCWGTGEQGSSAGPAGIPLNVFISYSHRDEKMREKLDEH